MIGGNSRVIAYAAMILLVGLLMAPNILWWSAARTTPSLVEGVVLPSLVLIFFFSIFGARIWIACALLTPFVVVAPAEIYYVATYGRPSTDQIIATIFASNPIETLEYFGEGLYVLLASAAVALAISITAVICSYRAHLHWQGRVRQGAVFVMLAVPVVLGVAQASSTDGEIDARLLAGWESIASLPGILENGYPLGPVVRVMAYREAWNEMTAAVATRQAFRFQTTAATRRPDRTVIVLAIGESSRRDRWQMFGYGRQTNPELSKISNLIPITDMINSWSASIRAIPQLLTRKPITADTSAWSEPSIVEAMEEAGFETWWISNQMPIGKFDSPVSMYAVEAQHHLFLNRATYEASGSYDEVLAQPLADVLKSENGRDVFIVLHLMGSHLRYDKRYPPAYKRFAPTLSDADTAADKTERTGNSYDNTIVYTDHVLATIIQILQKHPGPSALLFESDHGETLPTTECATSGHGIGDRFDFEVPAFFWFSDEYGHHYAEAVARLRANAGRPVLSADTFESIIDMSDLTYPGRETARSLFSVAWHERLRLVHAGETVDFDNAKVGSGCGMLFSKDPPRSESN